MNIKSLLFISALAMSSAAAQAQGIMVKGKVVDQHNEPIIGATVGVDNGKAKTVTATIPFRCLPMHKLLLTISA